DTSPTYGVSPATTQATVAVTPANDGQIVEVYSDQAPAAGAALASSALLAATQQTSVPLHYCDNLVGIVVTSTDRRTQSSSVLTIRRPALLDTTAPVVTAMLVPAPNAKGWRNGTTDVLVTANDPDEPGQPSSGVVQVEAMIDSGPWLSAGD